MLRLYIKRFTDIRLPIGALAFAFGALLIFAGTSMLTVMGFTSYTISAYSFGALFAGAGTAIVFWWDSVWDKRTRLVERGTLTYATVTKINGFPGHYIIYCENEQGHTFKITKPYCLCTIGTQIKIYIDNPDIIEDYYAVINW